MTPLPPLFPLADLGPPGLKYEAALITEAEESALIARFIGLAFEPFDFRGFKGNRRTVSFGSSYDFTHSRMQPAEAIPAWLLPLRDRAAGFAGIRADALGQAMVIDYPPGAGIGWHRDRPDYGRVVGVSFGSLAVLRLRRRTPTGWDRQAAPLAPRSAYLLDGAAREIWEHSIAPGAVQRYSVTFRTLR
ncbi:alpha-ketoglutarate-dependent dioxygenase AlkB [Brevundimonas sp.]|uniref:alpha-ketoglutarate-dependent dioxygenase AlkB n=1 Tax=Brevundimonas sp. TaxID=1871086 RepID=UPI003BADAA23